MERDPEAKQLAAFKIFDQIQKDHSRLWDKLWEFKTTGVVPPPVYRADEFTEGHRVMFAKINNREYDSCKAPPLLSSPPREPCKSRLN